jgi:hypothetical protein
MWTQQAQERFFEIKAYYDAIEAPKYRNADLAALKEQYQALQDLKDDLGQDAEYLKLVNALSQIIAKLEKWADLEKLPQDQVWSNLSERGMNKVIPTVLKSRNHVFPIEYRDKWRNECSVSAGYWSAKNYRVMDALGYMFVLKMGGDRLPEISAPIFNDLKEVSEFEKHLNGIATELPLTMTLHSVGFTDEDFREFTGLKLSSAEIMQLLLDTSRVEFKLSFPLRLKSSGNKEVVHRMHHYSRFFELSVEEVRVRSDDIVQARKYRVTFNTLLGQLFVNNLLARYNDRIDHRFYRLPESAQIFYRKLLIHHSYAEFPIHMSKISEAVGLMDGNVSNLLKTIESGILEPLKQAGYLESYEKVPNGNGIKYVIKRPKIAKIAKSNTGREAGSVKEGGRVGKGTRQGR